MENEAEVLKDLSTPEDDVLFVHISNFKSILDEAGYLDASDSLILLKKRIKEVTEKASKACDFYNKLHKRATIHRLAQIEPFKEAVLILNHLLTVYENEQDRKAKIEQERLEAIAKKQAEEEALAEAAALEAEGRPDEAEAVIEKPQPVFVAPALAPLKVKGLAKTTIWRYEITNRSKINDTFMIPNEKAIAAAVRSLKENAVLAVGAGIRVWPETSRRGTGK